MITLAKLERALERANRRIAWLKEEQRTFKPPYMNQREIEDQKAYLERLIDHWRLRRGRLGRLIRLSKDMVRMREIEARYEDVE